MLLLLTWEDSVPKKLQKVAVHKKSELAPEGLLGHPVSAKKLGYAR